MTIEQGLALFGNLGPRLRLRIEVTVSQLRWSTAPTPQLWWPGFTFVLHFMSYYQSEIQEHRYAL